MSDETVSQTNELHEQIGPVLGRTPSGIFILTASDGAGNETGMLASWVQQASFEPPMVTCAVNRKRYLIDWLKASPHLGLSLVGETQTQFLKHFGRGFDPDQPAFEDISVVRGKTGIPLLADALGYLEGRVEGQFDSGDHVVYLVEIIGSGALDRLESEKPMVHIRKNGFNY